MTLAHSDTASLLKTGPETDTHKLFDVDSFRRQLTEAVYIEELSKENSMNSKAEWTYVKLPRVEVA